MSDNHYTEKVEGKNQRLSNGKIQHFPASSRCLYNHQINNARTGVSKYKIGSTMYNTETLTNRI